MTTHRQHGDTRSTRPRVCQQLTRVICLVLLATEAKLALAAEADVRFARSYVSHDWGQIHVLTSHTVGASRFIPTKVDLTRIRLPVTLSPLASRCLTEETEF